MFNVEEIKAWEEEQLIKGQERFTPRKTRRSFDPKKERLFKARKMWTLKYGSYNESWSAAREWKRHIRAKYRLIDEDSMHPPKKEYHTRGWLTW